MSIWSHLDRLLARLRPYRVPIGLGLDGLMVVLAWNATYLFRVGFERWFSVRPAYDGWVLAAAVLAYLAAFGALGVPRAMWRFAGFSDMRRLALGTALAGTACAVGVMGLQLYAVPRSVLALHPLAVLMACASLRMAYRMLHEHMRTQLRQPGEPMRRAVVLGAGQAARRLLSGIQGEGWVVTALLDDDPAKHSAHIAGVAVAGNLTRLAEVAASSQATHVIVAMPTATVSQRLRALTLAQTTNLPVLTVPSAAELEGQAASGRRLRDIEPEDLLGREPVQLDQAGIAEVLQGRTVLVTGGGGSIGSELCRQIARFGPARLVVLELSEYNLYVLEQELGERWPQLERELLIGDVKDLASLRRIMQRVRPQVVFHAAAYKHVPLTEVANASAALRNNTQGTHHAALAAAEAGAQRFVLISTDKAVNPANVMGATKRAAELVVSALAVQHPQTRFMAVRFGNVLGSSGSVIPKFKAQIARGGPVTVTHPDIIRYFMTIPEAARLVLQAAAIGQSGQVLVLDMGEPVRIADLARTMIHLAGRTEAEIAIRYSGLRPGEKLYEELLADADATLPTANPAVRLAQVAALPALGEWLAHIETPITDDDVRAYLSRIVPEYRHAGP